jgi:hypothetical protein
MRKLMEHLDKYLKTDSQAYNINIRQKTEDARDD